MDFLRNPEIRQDVKFYSLFIIITAIVGLLISPEAAIGMVIVSLIACTYHFYSTRKRYIQLANLAEELDRVLHGEGEPGIERYTEGE
ncbi:MAG: hypothetical protein IJ315_06805, partial [Firmicutes bacterium]|nr:hypothetical protein [Bacillota bacterium]